MNKNNILAIIVLISFFSASNVRADENMQPVIDMPSGEVALKYWLDRAADRKALLDGFEKNFAGLFTSMIVSKIKEKYANCPSITADDTSMLKGNFEKINKFLSNTNNQECLRSFKCTPQEKRIVNTTRQTVYQNAKNKAAETINTHLKQFKKVPATQKYYWHSWHLVPELDKQVIRLQNEDPLYQNCQNSAFAKDHTNECQRNAAFYWYLSGICMETNEQQVKQEYMNQSAS